MKKKKKKRVAERASTTLNARSVSGTEAFYYLYYESATFGDSSEESYQTMTFQVGKNRVVERASTPLRAVANTNSFTALCSRR